MYMIRASLAISEGCRLKPGSLIQRDEPPALPPIPGIRTMTSSTRQSRRAGTAIFFQT